HFYALAISKNYINDHGFRFNPNLGYPGVQDQLFFPTFDFSYRAIIWLGSRFSNNPFVVINFLYLCGITAIFTTSYWTLRLLEIRRWLATVSSIVYILSPFFVTRFLRGHDFIALYFSIPFGVYLALHIGN